MKCPICKKPVNLGDPDFPFCCERCRTTDLGNWSAEKYRIPGPKVEEPRRQGEDEGE